MSLQTPRVLPQHLEAFNSGGRGQTVRMLGTVSALRGETATITCGSHGDVTLVLNQESHLQMGRMVEVVGKVTAVEQGLGLRIFTAFDCGKAGDVDYKIYENVVDVTHRYKDLFYESTE